MPDQNEPWSAWLDMTRYPNLDPDLALDAPVLEALRDILHSPDLAPVPASTVIAVLRDVLGITAPPGTTAQPDIPDMPNMPDMPAPPHIIATSWEHAPAPAVPYEPAYPEALNDDGHDPGPPHPLWLSDPSPEAQQYETMDAHTHPLHPGPGTEHAV